MDKVIIKISNNREQEIREYIENLFSNWDDREFEYYAIRGYVPHDSQYKEYAVGEYLPNSYDWDDGVKTDEMLDGTSGVQVGHYYGGKYLNVDQAINIAKQYGSPEHWIIIAGNDAHYGDDEEEIILRDARRVF